MTDQPTPEIDLTADTSNLLKAYGLLVIGMPMLYVTHIAVAVIGFFIVAASVMWVYRLRKEGGALIENHARWIIRTFWLSTLYTFFFGVIFALVFSSHADSQGMDALMQGMQNGTASPDYVRQQVDGFYTLNHSLLIVDWLACFTPVVLHAVWRYIKGYRLADKGRYLPDVRTWWL